MALKFYPKQLGNLDALKKERKRLKKTHARLNKEQIVDSAELVSLTGFVSSIPFRKRKTADGEESSSGILSALSGFLTSSTVLNNVIPLGVPLVKKLIKQHKIQDVAKEIFGGYLKWKALELGYRWIRRAVNKNAEPEIKHSKTKNKKSSFG